jgi:leucyl-tRNA synthetase
MSHDAGSSNQYQPRTFESSHQARWEEAGLHRAVGPGSGKPKYYVLDMFPYPSGSGLHVGHALGYVGTDIVARKKRMEGFDVLHPMGWDAFGLPAEQYAIQTGRHPRQTTDENTANFRRQLKNIGLSYDWSREIDTSHEGYYKHTQKLFKTLFEHGLAYRAEVPVWWCEELKTVLANEEVINGRSERGNHPCVRRPLKQWMLKITAYADRLLADLDGLDWPESIKIQQREWIGRSEGASIRFPLEAGGEVEVYTTRPDTLWGATFMVLAPEHPLVERIVTQGERAAVEAYAAAARSKSELERTELSKEKTGVFTGAYALNPLLDRDDPRARIPVWIADYVLWGYGTGAIMAVPGHDERDFEFARKHGLAVREVVQPPQGEKGLAEGACFSGEGVALASGPLDGLATPAAKARAIELLEQRGVGAKKTTYKLRDWLFSRQRYWGEPFPLVHLEDGTVVPLPDDALPVLLPAMDDFKPSPDGSAPLARAKDWVETREPKTGAKARRDTDTMPGWAGSCWYWLRFMDTANDKQPFSREAEAYWGPVDLYVGGASHAVMHLLYARFWHKVFFDAGLVHTKEPFQKLFNQGMVTAFAYEDASGRLVASDEVETKGDGFARKGSGEQLFQIVTKMAKSLKNVVNPDDIIEEHGCDAFRLYEMFMGPLADSKPWNPRDIPGCRRFLERLWRVFVDEKTAAPVRPHLLVEASQELQGDSLALEKALAKTLVRVEESFTHFNFNVAVAAFMTFVNEATKAPQGMTRSQAQRLLAALSPFAPHVAEELWLRLGCAGLCASEPWPKADPRHAVDDEIDLPVQVNGKLRATPKAPKDAGKDQLEAVARAAVVAHLEGKEVLKVVVVPGRLVNFVVKG